VSHRVTGPFEPEELARFLASLLYEPEAFLIDEVVRLDPQAHAVEASTDTTRPLPYTDLQRPSEGRSVCNVLSRTPPGPLRRRHPVRAAMQLC
jgi:hypothetical protein